MLERRDLSTAGGLSAVAVPALFVLGVVIVSATGGPDTVIPETGDGLVTWIEDVRDARTGFELGAGLVVVGGVVGIVAMLGFFDVLRGAGPLMIVAPVTGIVGLVFVTFSHVVPIVMAAELVPDFTGADASARAGLQTTGDLMAGMALATNYVGDVLAWGVAVPIFALAVLRTGALPRWIGWLGILVGVVGGWIGALGLASSTLEDVSALGFLAFFVWMAAMGIAMLGHRGSPTAESAPRQRPRGARFRARRARTRAGGADPLQP